MMQIKKRDGQIVPFDASKITNAMRKAFEATNHPCDEQQLTNLTNDICLQLVQENVTTVEAVQDTVEAALMQAGFYDVAKAYILYRAERTKARKSTERLMNTFHGITFQSAKDNDIKRENANIDADTAMGTMLKYGSEGAKEFNCLYVLKPEHIQAHRNGDIHIHDLDFLTLTTTCCQIDLEKLFKDGFATGHGFVREPNSIRTAASLACIAIQANQNDQHGGQSVPNFDYDLAPYVAKTYIKQIVDAIGFVNENVDKTILDNLKKELTDSYERFGTLLSDEAKNACFLSVHRALNYSGRKVEPATVERVLEHAYKLTEKETHQAMEALVHNLNTMHSRAGAQVPFSSINYGTDTSPEGRMITKYVLLATDEGLGHGETPIFPIHIFKVKEGINYNESDPNYDLFKLACKVSAKRLYPNFSFIDAPYNLKYYKEGDKRTEIAYMGCRTRVISNIYSPENEVVTGRGNLSFTSVNLPRLAIEAKGDVDKFFEMLQERVELVFDQLYERYQIVAKKHISNFPFLMGQGVWLDSDKLGPNDEIGEILKHGTLTVGFIGLAECLKALIGKHHGESEEAQELGLKIVFFMRNMCDEQAQKTKLNFSLIATPAEGLSGRFVKIDKEKYGIIPGVTDKEYYTNSFHIPVYYPIRAFEKIKLEAPYHALTNAGHITYVEMNGDPTKNLEAFESIVKYMKECGIGYGAINHPVDRDPVCGYTGIIDNECPRCHRTEMGGDVRFERIRRITGYLVGTLDRFNNAKKAEVQDRIKHI